MKYIFFLLLLFVGPVAAQFKSPVINLKDVTVLPQNFTQDFGSQDIMITGGTITDGSALPKLLNTTLPDLFEDGIYVVNQMPYYMFGGGFAHLQLTYNTAGKVVKYTQGTILEKKAGIWSRHFSGYGFKTSGSIICQNVSFENCLFYLFSPFGLKESKEISFINCKFSNVARVISSSLYGANDFDVTWCNALAVYPVNGDFRFSNMNFSGCSFQNIYTSIVWGCPPTRTISVLDNLIQDCPTAIAFWNCYMKKYNSTGSEEGYWSDKTVQIFRGNIFSNINQGDPWTTTLIRTTGAATIVNNRFEYVNPQIVLLYGGNSTFENNYVVKSNNPKDPQSAVVLVKNVGSPIHVVRRNQIHAPYSPFIAVEGTASLIIQENTGTVFSVFNKQHDSNGERQFVHISDNSMKSQNIITIASRDSTLKFGSVELMNNTFSDVVTERLGKTQIVNFIKQ